MWRAITLGFALALPMTAAHADAIVTLCNSDNQAGVGTNLSSALATGGRVTFACGSQRDYPHELPTRDRRQYRDRRRRNRSTPRRSVGMLDSADARAVQPQFGAAGLFQLSEPAHRGVKPPPQTPAAPAQGPTRLWKLCADGGELDDNGLDLAHRSDRGTGDPGQQHALRQRRRCRRRTQRDDPQSLGLRRQRGPATGSSGRRSGDRRLSIHGQQEGQRTSNSVQR